MTGPRSLPSLENLQTFLAAAEHGNFRRAAEQMHITAAAFGQRIKQLEQQLSTILFQRQHRTVQLTEAGQRLIPAARETLQAALRCHEVLHPDQPMPVTLTLGTRFELGMSWVLPNILEFQRQHPSWQIDLYFGSGPDLLEQLHARRVDCIVTSAPTLRKGWSAEFLHTERYALVASPALLAQTPFEALEDATAHTLLDVDEELPLTRYLTSAVGELGFREIRLCGAGLVMHDMAQRGLGVAVLPLYMVQQDIEEGRLCHLFPDISMLNDSFRLIFSRATIYTRPLQTLAAFLRKQPLQ